MIRYAKLLSKGGKREKMAIEYVKHLDMTEDRINLIYSMLLNIQDGVNSVIDDFDHKSPDWDTILKVLSENEAELVYILNNAKDQIEKEQEEKGEVNQNGK